MDEMLVMDHLPAKFEWRLVHSIGTNPLNMNSSRTWAGLLGTGCTHAMGHGHGCCATCSKLRKIVRKSRPESFVADLRTPIHKHHPSIHSLRTHSLAALVGGSAAAGETGSRSDPSFQRANTGSRESYKIPHFSLDSRLEVRCQAKASSSSCSEDAMILQLATQPSCRGPNIPAM